MLGLGASDLSLRCKESSELNSTAIAHRIQAVRLLNQAFLTPPKDGYELDARFATLVILTFQSACMSEGLTDFLTMLRGCILQRAPEGAPNSCFAYLMPNHSLVMEQRLSEAQLESLDIECLDQAMMSLAALKPYCKPGVEEQFHELLCQVIQHAYISLTSGGLHNVQDHIPKIFVLTKCSLLLVYWSIWLHR